MYFEGKAYELSNLKEMLVGLGVVYKREKRKPRDVIQFLKKFPRRIYKFVLEKVWVNGDSEIDGNLIDVRTELDLGNVRAAVMGN